MWKLWFHVSGKFARLMASMFLNLVRLEARHVLNAMSCLYFLPCQTPALHLCLFSPGPCSAQRSKVVWGFAFCTSISPAFTSQYCGRISDWHGEDPSYVGECFVTLCRTPRASSCFELTSSHITMQLFWGTKPLFFWPF